MSEPWIQTFTGRKFYPFSLQPERQPFAIEDIAHALALTTRYGGHCREFYSVAQHSVLVSKECDPQHALSGLMHDAAEAYLGDIPRPIKHSEGMEQFRRNEKILERRIMDRYTLPFPFPDSVVAADAALLATEKRDICTRSQEDMDEDEWLHGASAAAALDFTIVPVSPGEAEIMWLSRYRQLVHDRSLRWHEQREATRQQIAAAAEQARREMKTRQNAWWAFNDRVAAEINSKLVPAPFTGTPYDPGSELD